MRDSLTSPPALLRLAVGLFLVLYVGAMGFVGRSAWIILPLGLVFTLLYFIGKSAARTVWRTEGLRAFIKPFFPRLRRSWYLLRSYMF